MMDGNILFISAARDVRFLVAGKSMRRPVLKQMFEAADAIPVERAQDLAKQGAGTIQFVDNLNIKGIGTNFKKDF